MPIKASPTVPDVPQDVPVAKDTIEHIKSVASKNMAGDNIMLKFNYIYNNCLMQV